ncbi:trafficking protein particle complex subunit 8 isoform X1 [Selaginella moellendorffii]|uniref:trafficking protein particle complex subunit 8 isoform X1 n=1 Tax=Selaginella moellendorffii TaxID=88036 RepID=UPI000D1C3950|nr:trafficking protein particle complex subunit 8 isoform X1 [Selaginella moellendorffii]|eukprot:XP_024543290.1 trafficking protein particle complex subunit 8 isoform X1 [Selaginella moellendorffii]
MESPPAPAAPGNGAASLLSQILLQSVSPVVMVLASPRAEAACRKNNLGFVDLLRPFCFLDRVNVPVRTASETPYRLQEFRLRLFYASEIRATPIELAEQQLLDVVNEAALDEIQGDDLRAQSSIESVHRAMQSESTLSWFQKYSTAFARTLAFSEHEAFDHPVACLLVVSSNDENPLDVFASLSDVTNLPSLLKDGAMDPRILRHYVVLHDNQDGPSDRANEMLQNFAGTLDVNDCSLIRINSSPLDNGSPVEDIWSSSMPRYKISDNLKTGCCLQINDVDEIQRFVIDLCQKHIIPYMEQKVRYLNQQVAATRRGLKNQLKNLWWRKKDSEYPDTPSGNVYTYNSVESQIRVLADYSFMLQDYDLAVSNYRLLSSDYKADRALKRYAGVMEMLGICLCLLDQSRKEADNSLETAYITYQTCGPPSIRYATRTALWWAEVHKTRAQYSEAASVLFRAGTEMDKDATLRAGVLLEQSAYCFLRCVPPMLRKYGFHLVLAGIRYHMSSQRKHALRAYSRASAVYDGQGWNFIGDHVNVYLGRISLLLGKVDAAVQHFMNIMACSHQSAPTQAQFLKEFLNAVQNLETKDEVLRVRLPAISSDDVYVRFEDHRTYASAMAASVPEAEWALLEEELVPPSSGAPITTWLDAGKSNKKIQDFNVCVSGEDVCVFLKVSNPLQISIEVFLMELICEFQPKKRGPEEMTSSKPENSSLILSNESFSLKGGEEVEVCLKTKPIEEGLLQVVGVKWGLCGIVQCRYDFPVQGKSKSSKPRKSKIDVPFHKRLKFNVVAHMPRLEISMHELPPKINRGEVRRVVLEIQNPSQASIKNIKLKTSHPAFLMFGEQGDLDLEFPNCLEMRNDGQPKDIQCEHGSSIFHFPEKTFLEGVSTFLWPLWLHASHDGKVSFKTVLYFEPCEDTTSLKYRTLRMVHSVQVIPSLQVSVGISSCPVKLDQYLLRMDVANVHPSDSFWLRQASSIGDDWCFSAVQPQVLEQADNDETLKAAFLSSSVSPSQLLPATQSSSFFFQLRRDVETKHGGGTVRLGPPSSEEPLINISSGPLSYFHQQEKIVQIKTSQQDARYQTVDIVLITGQQDDMITEKAAGSQRDFRIASHHVCHCRVEGSQPLVWAMEGPRCLAHDFATQGLCEVPVFLALRNCSQLTASVKVETCDWNDTGDGGAKAGWRSASPPPTLEALASSGTESSARSDRKLASSGPYVWCCSKSVTSLELAPGASTRVPLCVGVLAPGMYDLSNYRISWRLLEAGKQQAETVVVAPEKAKRSNFVAAPAIRAGDYAEEAALSPVDRSDGGASNTDRAAQVGEGAGHSFLFTVIQMPMELL